MTQSDIAAVAGTSKFRREYKSRLLRASGKPNIDQAGRKPGRLSVLFSTFCVLGDAF
jgi:hypothetical protein